MALSPQLGIANMRGVLQFGRGSFALEEIDGSIAGGRVAGSISFERGEDGLSLDTHVRFAGANLAELLPGEGALIGRATIDLDLQGTGRSPVALIGALKGDGTFTVQDGQIMRVDPSVFAAVIRSVDEGLADRCDENSRPHGSRARQRCAGCRAGAGRDRGRGRPVAPRQHRDPRERRRARRHARPRSVRQRHRCAADLVGRAGLRRARRYSSRDRASRCAGRSTRRSGRSTWPHSRAGLRCAPSRKRTSASTRCNPAARSRCRLRLPRSRSSRHRLWRLSRTRSRRSNQPKAPQRAPAAKAAPPPTDIRPPAAARPQTPPKQAQPQPQRPASRSWLENLLGP